MQTLPASLSTVSYADVRTLTQGPPSSRDLDSAAAQFESIFVDWMLKSMRDATATLSEGSYLGSSEVEMHQEMLDHQLAIHLSENGGLGLREIIASQLKPPGAPAAEVDADPKARPHSADSSS